MSEVDAIVLDLDGGAELVACLESLARQSRPLRRVVVFDNGSDVPVAARLPQRDWPFQLHLLRSEANEGFTGGINRAMGEVEAPLVAWINNDVVLDRDWLAALIPHFENGSVAAVQSVIARTDGRVDGAGIDVSTGRFLQAAHGAATEGFVAAPPWGVSATAVLFRVAALRSVSPAGAVLRPDFFAYYEDVELSARLRARGWRFALEPRPLATHAGSMTGGRMPRLETLRVRNRYLVARIHPGTGRLRSLLTEDLRRTARALLKREWRRAGRICVGVLRGLGSPIPPLADAQADKRRSVV